MTTLVQVLLGVIALMTLGLGAKSMFAPKSMLDNFAVDPRGKAGLNTIRGVIGGLFIALMSMVVTGLVTGETLWFLAVAIVLGVVAAGRVVGLAADGFEKAAVPPLVLESVMVAVLVSGHVVLGAG